MYYVYAIRSLVRNYIYVGLTNMVERRINEHNKGQNRSTKAYIPFELIYVECLIQEKKQEKKRYI